MQHLTVPGESSSTSLVRVQRTDADGNRPDDDDDDDERDDDDDGAPHGSRPERKVSNVRANLRRFQKSFRVQAHHVKRTIQHEAQRVRQVPRWVRVAHTLYHEWGLKHVCLIAFLIAYNFLGAAIFYFCEASHDESQEVIWKDDVQRNRTRFIQSVIPTMFNNSEFLFFLTGEQTLQVEERLDVELRLYEMQLGVKYKPDQKIKWDFWNAMLYAQTLCTTIGDAQLYTVTVFGRIFTMVYATFGIPLVLSVLDDMGKLLTKCLKTPWWLIKCGCRRIFRYCTKQSMLEIRRLDAEDKHDLEVFDLPIPIAVFVVIAWIFICSATFCIWEKDWDYFTAFYFFFICVSTIGLGDITPSKPKFFLLLFIYIIIGLSLASMCLNLIQAKMKRTYDAGQQQFDNMSSIASEGRLSTVTEDIRRRGSSLGVFRGCGSAYSLNREAIQAMFAAKHRHNKSCQTMLSFSSPARKSGVAKTTRSSGKMRFLPRTLSVDDVMKLVDTEEGDILLLTELAREASDLSGAPSVSSAATNDSNEAIVVSKSFDTNFNPMRQPSTASNGVKAATIERMSSEVRLPTTSFTLQELEAQEEMEDRLALGCPIDSSVHFRSRLSLIPEQHSVIDEDGEQSSVATESEPSRPSSIDPARAEAPAPGSVSMGSRLSGLLHRHHNPRQPASSSQPPPLG